MQFLLSSLKQSCKIYLNFWQFLQKYAWICFMENCDKSALNKLNQVKTWGLISLGFMTVLLTQLVCTQLNYAVWFCYACIVVKFKKIKLCNIHYTHCTYSFSIGQYTLHIIIHTWFMVHHAFCIMQYALCILYFALCILYYALCIKDYALWILHNILNKYA